MRPRLLPVLSVLAGVGLSIPAQATYNATAVGTIGAIQQMSTSLQYTAETTSFIISGQPSVSCANFQRFVISPATVTDAQTRKNMIAILLTAKASGAQVTVAYDSSGGDCDQGMIAVYYLVIN